MKKSFVMFLLTLIIESTNSQVWIDRGATWHYNFSFMASGGFEKIVYTGDTIISGNTCQKLSSEQFNFAIDQFGNIIFVGSQLKGENYTYTSGDTIFWLQGNQFFVLYNFGAQPGDRWDVGFTITNSDCSNSLVKVDSIGTSSINGAALRWISISPDTNSIANFYGKAFEKFGSLEGYLFPTNLNSCDSSIIVDYTFYNLACYEDTNFSYINAPNNDCEYLLHLGIYEKLNTNLLSIYPNPSSGIVTIYKSNLQNYHAYIFNQLGLLEKEFSIKEKTESIDLSYLKNGIHTIKFVDENGQQLIKKIVLN